MTHCTWCPFKGCDDCRYTPECRGCGGLHPGEDCPAMDPLPLEDE